MTSRRYAKPRHQPGNRDENEPAIVEGLQRAGFSFFELHVPCDLLVGRRRRTHLVEVKKSDGRMTDEQLDFVRTWRGCYHLVRDPQDALEQLRECEAGVRSMSARRLGR